MAAAIMSRPSRFRTSISEEAETQVTAKDITLGGLSIPGNPNGGTINDIVLYETAGTGPVTVTSKGKQVFSMEESEANLTKQESDAGFDFDATMSGIKADLSDVEDAKAKDAIEKLGLKALAERNDHQKAAGKSPPATSRWKNTPSTSPMSAAWRSPSAFPAIRWTS